MRAPDEVNVHHLVVDAGGFIKNAPLIVRPYLYINFTFKVVFRTSVRKYTH